MILKKLGEITLLKYLEMFGKALATYLLVNLISFLVNFVYKYKEINRVSFDDGVFSINGENIGYNIESSIRFIFFLFIAFLYVHIKKSNKATT